MKEMSVKTVVLCLAVGLSCLCGAETVATFTRSSNSSSIDTGARITTTAFTVEMWLNPTTIESGDNVVFAQDIGGDAGRFNIVPRGGGTLFVQVGNNNFAPACPLPVGTWTHLAFTRDDKGEATLYTNGVRVTSTKFNINALSAANIILGRQDRSPGNGFNGLMGDVRVWEKCRTQAEINSFMRQRLAGDEEGLISYFRLDDGGANAPYDSARNVNGTFKNGASWTDDASFADRGAPIDNTALVFTRSANSAYVQTTNRITSVALTVEMWVKPRTIADADNLLFSQDIGGDKGRFNILLHGQEVWLHIGGYFPKVAYPVPTNKWTHIAFTRTGDGAGTIYANGDIIATANMGTDLPSAADIVIGLQRRSPGNGFDGQISEVRVWNYARTYEEIVGNKNRRLTGQEYGLVCLYPLNENFGAAYVRDAVTGYYAPVTFFAGWRETVNLPLTDELPPALRFVRAMTSSSCTVVKTTNRIATVAFTIEAWVKPERFESGDNYLFSQDINGDAGRLIISQQGNGSTYYFQVGGNVLKPSGTLPVNTWTHLAFVRDADGIGSIYTNGQLLATGALNKNIPSATDFRIGRLDRIFEKGFIGLMSDVRVWSVARGEDEIVADMGRRLGGRETGLVSYFRLDEGGENPPRDAVRAMDSAFVNGACWAHDATFPNRMARIVDARKERALEKAVAERIADLALVPPRINTNPLPDYDYDRLDYAMNNGIAMTPGGRIYASWVAGGDSPAAFFVCNSSDDCGETWSKPCFVINMHSDRLPLNRSTIVGNLWTDPKGRLWFFFSQSMEHCDGRAGSWCAVCDNPDAAEPKWSASRRLFHGYSLNKPLVLKNGTWLLGVELPSALGYFARVNAFDSLNAYRGANVMRSTDEGRTWEWLSCMKFPRHDWDEHILLERDDGRIWMVARTGAGLRQTFSSDGGRTWDAPTATNINHPVARFQILHLASGRLLLVKHGPSVGETDGVRHDLKAFLSNDNGATWVGGLMLDERNSVSYPDGFQAPDGRIYISYDHNRGSDAEICMARFTEADVLAGSLVTATSRLKILVSKGTAKNR